ncbi:helix-turn-helix domain-containing protein [Saccharothrix syringae]|uniref:XRE family transcriptional regulator n=1 Tax=Saccharothrix syringae TaxID=103733 RepID=A0A5Q0GVV8_SACSY|nr:helix-turn-helix transcriptional regulator [Saccharothrix syringae]QFZ18061.1 XRE family transcriptional regulator [Saccharothrix syringae]
MTAREPMPPFVHKIVAGRQLEMLRTAAGLTQEQVADACGWSQTKVVNVEQGAIRVRPDDLERLLGVLRPDDEQRRRIHEHVEAGRAPIPKSDLRWRFKGDALRKVVEMERSAAVMSSHSSMFVPGLLQTEAYMRHHFLAFRPALEEAEIERLTSLRLQRQRVLDNTDQEFVFSIDQAALARMGNMPGANEQLLHLLQADERPNVSLLFVPFAHGYYRGQEAQYSIFQYDADPTIHFVYVERYDGREVVSDPKHVAGVLDLWEEQRAAGLKAHEATPFLRFLSGASRS